MFRVLRWLNTRSTAFIILTDENHLIHLWSAAKLCWGTRHVQSLYGLIHFSGVIGCIKISLFDVLQSPNKNQYSLIRFDINSSISRASLWKWDCFHPYSSRQSPPTGTWGVLLNDRFQQHCYGITRDMCLLHKTDQSQYLRCLLLPWLCRSPSFHWKMKGKH